MYRLPLLQIVGVTSTSKTFSVAFSYMNAEKEDNYNWALTCFKDLFDGELKLVVMITDRGTTLVNAVRNVFPETKNILCRVHIERNVLSNCVGELKDKVKFDAFMKMWYVVMHSSNTTEYDANIEKLHSTYKDYPKVLAYVTDSWLLKYKNYFFSAWVDRFMHLGNTTTNKVEGSHAKLKKYLTNSVKGFVDSFKKINILLASQIIEVKASIKDRVTKVPLRFINPFFNQIVGFVSTIALEKTEQQLASMGSSYIDASQCNHSALYSLGIPRAHMLSRYREEGRCIPLDDILNFWKKLNMTDFYGEKGEEMNIETEINMIYNMFAAGIVPQKMELKRKLQELYASNTTTLEPTPKANIRGRKKKHKGGQTSKATDESTKRHPSQFELVLGGVCLSLNGS